MAQTQICKFYMDKGCNNGNCKFFHDPDLCVTYWTEGQCLIPDCRYNHKYINQICKYFLKFGTCKFEKCKFIMEFFDELDKLALEMPAEESVGATGEFERVL